MNTENEHLFSILGFRPSGDNDGHPAQIEGYSMNHCQTVKQDIVSSDLSSLGPASRKIVSNVLHLNQHVLVYVTNDKGRSVIAELINES